MKKLLGLGIVLMMVSMVFMACSKNEDPENYPARIDGIWSYMDASTGYTCELVIGGDNSMTSKGVYSRVTVARDRGNYDVLIGGLNYNASEGSGKIMFETNGEGGASSADLSVKSESQLVMQIVSPTPNEFPAYTLSKVAFPQSITGTWSGVIDIDGTDANIIFEVFPKALNGSTGKIHIYIAEEDKFIYDMPICTYDPKTGTGAFTLKDTENDAEWNNCTGTLRYDYKKDAVIGEVTDSEDGMKYSFELRSIATVD